VWDENKTLMARFVWASDKGNLEISFPMDTCRGGHPANGAREKGKTGRGRIGAVVVTGSVSANVDYDNDTVAVYGTPRLRGCG
jgi:hypothetical protein